LAKISRSYEENKTVPFSIHSVHNKKLQVYVNDVRLNSSLTVPFCARNDIDWSMPPPSVPMYHSQCWQISASSNYNSIQSYLLSTVHTR